MRPSLSRKVLFSKKSANKFSFPAENQYLCSPKKKIEYKINPLRDLNQDDKGRHYQQDC